MKSVPKIGMRIVKSAVAVFLCYIVNYFRGEDGIVFYSQLSALWCIQSYISTTKKNAAQRTVGTFVGAGFGLVVLLLLGWLKTSFSLSDFWLYFIQGLLTSASIIYILYVTVVIKKKQASYFSCVVFLSIVVIHAGDANPYFFTFNRFFDTMIGIVIGVAVNLFHLPRKKNRDILFISGLDDTLLDNEYHLNDYCKVELNRMLDEGLNFTLCTLRPPASIVEPMKEIKLKIPVIAMGGAVLYDTNEKRYLEKIELEPYESVQIKDILEEQQVIYFANVVIDDTLLIYYNKTELVDFNQTQKEFLKQLRKSPYRNYINRPVPENEPVVYYMLFYPTQRINQLYTVLETKGILNRYKVLKYESKDYEGYSYLKIYNKTVNKENMIELLKRRMQIEKTVSFGTIPYQYDYVVKEGDTNEVVHKMKRLFEY